MDPVIPRSSPRSALKSDVFPVPVGPMMATISPGRATNEVHGVTSFSCTTPTRSTNSGKRPQSTLEGALDRLRELGSSSWLERAITSSSVSSASAPRSMKPRASPRSRRGRYARKKTAAKAMREPPLSGSAPASTSTTTTRSAPAASASFAPDRADRAASARAEDRAAFSASRSSSSLTRIVAP